MSALWANSSTVFAATSWASYESFVGEHFTPQEIAAGKSAPDYDFLGSGRSNLLAYALGKNPKTEHSGPWTMGFDGGFWAAEIELLSTAGDLAIAFETSSNLANWNPAAPSQTGVIDLGDIRRVRLMFDRNEPRLFLRVRATLGGD